MTKVRREIVLDEVAAAAIEQSRSERLLALRTARETKARAALKKWTTRLKRATNEVRRLRRRVLYYESVRTQNAKE